MPSTCLPRLRQLRHARPWPLVRDQDRKVAELSAENNKWECENDKSGKDLNVLRRELD